MKNVLISVFTNLILSVAILFVAIIGFFGVDTVKVSGVSQNLFYRGNAEKNSVSLMFNVYENTENVQKILQTLQEYGAKCTFFIGGSWADDNIDCVKSIFSQGHEVASHGYFHKDHSKMDYSKNLEEITPSVKLLNMICNTKVTLFAPPSGAFCQETLTCCEAMNLKVIMWSRDTIDWRDKDANLIYSRATKDLQAGEFILMHPTDCTVSALPKILDYINKVGLQAKTVSYNLGE
ncbi:MAG: hypothetical protein E7370_00630 [Clostridiales bacterium]|nr:hypothetical protein [Clostridiales bacterium]